MLLYDDMIYVGALVIAGSPEIAALVALPVGYFREFNINEKESKMRAEYYFQGAMDQGMIHNPVLRLFESWDFIPEDWHFSDLSNKTTILI